MRTIPESMESWLKSLDISHTVTANGYVEMPIYGRIALAVLVPWLQFFTLGRPVPGIICLLLQGSLIGWFPAMIWSLYTLYLHQGTPPDEMRDTIQNALGRLANDRRKPPEVMLHYALEIAQQKGTTLPDWALSTRAACQIWIMANE